MENGRRSCERRGFGMEESVRRKKRSERRLAWKMFASYLLASLLPIAVILSFFISRNIESAKKNLIRMAEPYCDRIADNVSLTIAGAEDEINALKSSDFVFKLLFSEYGNPADAITAYQLQWLQGAKYLVNPGHTVKIYNTVTNGNIAPLTNNSLNDFIRIYGADAVDTGSAIRSKLLPKYGVSPERIGLYSSLSTASRNMFVTVEVPIREILPSLETETVLGGYVYLLDESGKILGSTDSEEKYSGMITADFLKSIKDTNSVERNGEEFLTLTKTLSGHSEISSECAQWEILYLIPNELFQNSLRANLLETLPLCLLSVFFSLGVAIAFTKWLTGRLNILRSKTNRIFRGDFDISEPIRNRDELGELEESIYEMSAALESMFQDQYNRLKKENEQKVNNERLLRSAVQAEINALRYQINPHYLFNTMESIRMHLYLKGDRETANVIQQFSASFRKILDAKGADCSLSDELATVESYLQVQKYRLGDRFESEILVAPEIDQDCIIPKLLLQPLVENAFTHGIELSDKKGVLQICVSLRENCLVFSVIDNGVGMSEEKLEALRRMIEDPDGSERIGLRNIVKRLKLLFGEGHGFRIESREGVGTSVFVSIPYQSVDERERTDEGVDC